MSINRFNYSDDFVLNNGNVGINSSLPQEKLDVVGTIKAENLSVVGVSSLTVYEGFLRSNHNITENTSLEGGQGITGSLSGEIIVGTGVTVTGVTTATSGQGYIDSLKVYNTFTVPVGLTADRPTAPKPGQLYYNRDFASIEFYDGDRWRHVDNTTTRGRGVFGGDGSGKISYVNISSTGNAVNFGILSALTLQHSACSSSTRGVFGGGTPVGSNVIEYITISSEGNSIDFGDLTVARRLPAACSSSTRGIWGGGVNPTQVENVIDYITISTIGNALDFGDLTIARRTQNGAASSATRGVFLGGRTPSQYQNVMEFVTISSTGNAIDFEDSLFSGGYRAGCSSSVRAVYGGGYNGPAPINAIEYLTIATTGNSIYFGDLSFRSYAGSACSNSIRGLFTGGYIAPLGSLNSINYITIASVGNAQDFGDLAVNGFLSSACSDSHGGLGGF